MVVELSKIPDLPKEPKINEWARKPIVIGIMAGLNAAIWGVLVAHWLGLI